MLQRIDNFLKAIWITYRPLAHPIMSIPRVRNLGRELETILGKETHGTSILSQVGLNPRPSHFNKVSSI